MTLNQQIEAWHEWLSGRSRTLPRPFSHWTSAGTIVIEPVMLAHSPAARLSIGGVEVGDDTHFLGSLKRIRLPEIRERFGLPEIPYDLSDWNGLR